MIKDKRLINFGSTFILFEIHYDLLDEEEKSKAAPKSDRQAFIPRKSGFQSLSVIKNTNTLRQNQGIHKIRTMGDKANFVKPSLSLAIYFKKPFVTKQ